MINYAKIFLCTLIILHTFRTQYSVNHIITIKIKISNTPSFNLLLTIMKIYYLTLLTYLNAYLSCIEPTYESIFRHFSFEIRCKTMKDSTKTTSLSNKRSFRYLWVKAEAIKRIQHSFVFDTYFGNPKKQFNCKQWNYNKSLINALPLRSCLVTITIKDNRLSFVSPKHTSAKLIKKLPKGLYRNKQIEMGFKDIKNLLAYKLKHPHHNNHYSDFKDQMEKSWHREKILNINKQLPAVSGHLQRKYDNLRTWISLIWKQHHNPVAILNHKNCLEDSSTLVKTTIVFVILLIDHLFVCLIFIYLKYQLLKKQRNKLAISTLELSDATKKPLTLKDSIVSKILQHLEDFEKNKEFLSEGIHLNNLAQRWHTNRNYLSNCINTYKEKSFIDYVNDLRIKYFIEHLKENHKRFRCLTIAAIGQELGFSSARSFSKAFVKVMHMPLSQYLSRFTKEDME